MNTPLFQHSDAIQQTDGNFGILKRDPEPFLKGQPFLTPCMMSIICGMHQREREVHSLYTYNSEIHMCERLKLASIRSTERKSREL